jgi:hypothetical protein
MSDETAPTMNVPARVRIPFLNDFTRQCRILPGPRNPECGNARHYYLIQLFDKDGVITHELPIHFQEGALTENPRHNGVFSIALLAVLKDHFESFQDGDYACRENALVITKIEEAMLWACARADERATRGVLGKHQK